MSGRADQLQRQLLRSELQRRQLRHLRQRLRNGQRLHGGNLQLRQDFRQRLRVIRDALQSGGDAR
jgi:hypothetical protein